MDLQYFAIPYGLVMRNLVAEVANRVESGAQFLSGSIFPRAALKSLDGSWPEPRSCDVPLLIGAVAKSNPEAEAQLAHQMARRVASRVPSQALDRLLNVFLLLRLEHAGIRIKPRWDIPCLEDASRTHLIADFEQRVAKRNFKRVKNG